MTPPRVTWSVSFSATDSWFERRLAATILLCASLMSAVVAGLWAVALPVLWAVDPDGVSVWWPVLNAATAAAFVWVSLRFAHQARAYAAGLGDGGRLVRLFVAFYLFGALWTGVAVPFWGLIMPLAYAPMFLAGLAGVLLVVRVLRVLRSRTWRSSSNRFGE
jgi:hypothetical protein